MLKQSLRSACGLILLLTTAGVRAEMQAPVYTYQVVAKYPHSTASYTEGFFYRDGLFYEGTGLKGHSAVLAIRPETGKTVQSLSLPPQYFEIKIVTRPPMTIMAVPR